MNPKLLYFGPMRENTSAEVIAAARELSVKIDKLKFGLPVTHVYNPLNYAWAAHEEYLRKYASASKQVIFLGMNPGPFGMVQSGVPFGEVAAVRDWLGISARIKKPTNEHPKRPISGLDCQRSEVSGRRLWKLFADRFETPEQFFAEHFVANYCPLAFCEESGCNRTPDKLPTVETERLFSACDEHLKRIVEILEPAWLIGVGAFARERAELVCDKMKVNIGQILHPSPASPLANRDWSGTATRQLFEQGIWK